VKALPPILYHYTCRDAMAGIARDRRIVPHVHPWLPELGKVIWLTDVEGFALTTPEQIGLTSNVLRCDRTEFRYAINTAMIDGLRWWPRARRRCDPLLVSALERHARPSRWWVTSTAIPDDAFVTVALMTERGAVHG